MGSTRALLMPSLFCDPSLLLNINSGLWEVPTGYSQHPHGIRHPSTSLISPWPAAGASDHAQALLLHGWVRSTARPTLPRGCREPCCGDTQPFPSLVRLF